MNLTTLNNILKRFGYRIEKNEKAGPPPLHLIGKSTDIKPRNPTPGSSFFEVDKRRAFIATTKGWEEIK